MSHSATHVFAYHNHAITYHVSYMYPSHPPNNLANAPRHACARESVRMLTLCIGVPARTHRQSYALAPTHSTLCLTKRERGVGMLAFLTFANCCWFDRRQHFPTAFRTFASTDSTVARFQRRRLCAFSPAQKPTPLSSLAKTTKSPAGAETLTNVSPRISSPCVRRYE